MKILLLLLFVSVSVFAQDLKLTECNTTKFPEVNLTLHTRKPNTGVAKDFKITENISEIENYELIPEKNDKNFKRVVLILFENSNPPMFTPQREYFKTMLQKSLGESFSNDDIIYFSEFDWTDKNGKALPKEKVKKGKAAEIIEIVKSVSLPPSNGTKLSLLGQTCLARAVMEGIEFLDAEKYDTSYCKSIFLFSGASNDNINSNVSSTDIMLNARAKNISIYSVDYPRMSKVYNTEKQSTETFGLHFRTSVNEVEKYTDSLKTFFKAISPRASGVYYNLKYTTKAGAGNVAVNLKITNKNLNLNQEIRYNTPSYSNWIFSSIIRTLLLILAVLLLTGTITFFVLKNRKKQKLAKIETEKKISEIEEKNKLAEEENKRLIKEQEEKFKKEKEAERQRQQQEKEEQARKVKDEESLSRLHNRGRIPTLIDMSGNVYQISKPVVKIGRIEGNDLQIEDKTVSKNHAVIMYERQSPDDLPIPSNEFFILDLNSANGTFVNNIPVSSCVKLKDGDLIRFANISANFRC